MRDSSACIKAPGRNLSSAGNPILELNITSIGEPVAKLWPFLYIQEWPSDAILDFIEPEITPFDPPTLKTLASSRHKVDRMHRLREIR